MQSPSKFASVTASSNVAVHALEMARIAPITGELRFVMSSVQNIGQWHKCDGHAISKALHPKLAALMQSLGETVGADFPVPDLDDTIPIGNITGATNSIAVGDTNDTGSGPKTSKLGSWYVWCD